MVNRIPCINTRCKRTGDPVKMPNTNTMICGRCWRLLPQALKGQYDRLRRRDLKLRRLAEKRIAHGTLPRYRLHVIGGLIDRQIDRNIDAIASFLNNPEKPVGLDGFLEEMGL